MRYHVCEILSGQLRYAGRSMIRTAEALEAGTCYGWGKDDLAALIHAERQRQTFIRRKWTLPEELVGEGLARSRADRKAPAADGAAVGRGKKHSGSRSRRSGEKDGSPDFDYDRFELPSGNSNISANPVPS